MALKYTSYADITARFGERIVRQAFTRRGDTNAALPDETTEVDPKIDRASRRVDGYLSPFGISVPFADPPPSQVKDITEVWTLIEARRDADGGRISEADTKLEGELIARLDMIGQGKEKLEGIDVSPSGGPVSSVTDGRAAVWTEYSRDSAGNVINPDQILPSLEKIL